MLDLLTLGLRLREGLSLNAFSARFGVDLLELVGDTGRWLLDAGFLERFDDDSRDRVRVAADHQLITNEILVRLEEPLLERAQVRRETSASQTPAR
jgi:coproporphyrinogen III oxidase-like Fe-S oxidoreductase